jgi:hypothetical protein
MDFVLILAAQARSKEAHAKPEAVAYAENRVLSF